MMLFSTPLTTRTGDLFQMRMQASFFEEDPRIGWIAQGVRQSSQEYTDFFVGLLVEIQDNLGYWELGVICSYFPENNIFIINILAADLLLDFATTCLFDVWEGTIDHRVRFLVHPARRLRYQYMGTGVLVDTLVCLMNAHIHSLEGVFSDMIFWKEERIHRVISIEGARVHIVSLDLSEPVSSFGLHEAFLYLTPDQLGLITRYCCLLSVSDIYHACTQNLLVIADKCNPTEQDTAAAAMQCAAFSAAGDQPTAQRTARRTARRTAQRTA